MIVVASDDRILCGGSIMSSPSGKFLSVLLFAAVMVAHQPAFAASCKSYRSCAEAVKAWCEGRHPGADRDKDGIPCENVCRSLRKVKAEKTKINCVK